MKYMNNSIKATVLAAGVALVSQALQAANNDLVLGFTGVGAANDYLINLGQASTLIGASSVVDLSGFLNLGTFNSTFGSASSVSMGIGGGTSSSTPNVFLTGSASPADQTLSDASARAADFNQVINAYSGLSLAGGSATAPITDVSSFSQAIYGTSGLLGQQGINISSPISGGIVYEDLYQTTQVGTGFSAHDTYSYAGYFALNLTGNSPSLTFTSVAVPEPATSSIMAGAGVLLLMFRRRFGRTTA